jgi:cytochrome c oxidase subunit 1/cytochrome c oxidase subunit I+III
VLNVGYILDDGREALGTTALDGEPNIILKMPGDSYAPLFLGVFSTLIFAGMVLHAWWFAATMLGAGALSVIAWLWPERGLLQREPFPVHDEGGEIG